MMKPDPYTVRLELPLVRVVIAASILIVLSANAVAQCKSQPAQLADLESHLNGTLAQLAKIVPEQRPKEYRELQEQALRELEQVQCAREEAAPAEAVRRGPALKTPFALVPVLFVTDRQPLSAPHDGHKYFGWERVASGVTYGRVVARMPAEDYSVTSPVPHGVKIVTEANAQGGVSVDAPETLTREDITKHIRDYKASLPHGELTRVLIFVHGFNVTYPEAIQALARLSFGLHIDVLPVALSWPSQGSLPKYWNDEENIEPSIERLRPELLWLLSHPDIDEVILVAHSMGS
ncbi:MAG: alpha/beta hydrolase, partial [Acidobacteria bacterium]|nr:alpha/beta hydrolase [Acidobacteriota bacterium]